MGVFLVGFRLKHRELQFNHASTIVRELCGHSTATIGSEFLSIKGIERKNLSKVVMIGIMKYTFIILVLFLQGCASGFKTYYAPADTSTFVVPLEPNRQPEVIEVSSAEIGPLADKYCEDGWILLGQSSFWGPDGSSSQAQTQAKSIGAHKVLYTYWLQGTSTVSIPITSPTYSYTSGTVSSGGAYGSYSGTTYGTSTTYVPIRVTKYNFFALYISPRKYKPILGLYCRRKSPAEQAESGNINGLYVLLVVRNSPAAVGGILPGDTILKLDNKVIDENIKLDSFAGKKVTFEIIRKGVPSTLSLTLGKNNDPL